MKFKVVFFIAILALFFTNFSKAQSYDWTGKYYCEPQIADFPIYVLIIKKGSSGNYDCSLSATGKQLIMS